MKATELHLSRLRQYTEEKRKQGQHIREFWCDSNPIRLMHFPPQKLENTVILKEDTFVELGNPSKGSSALVVWSDNLSLIKDGHITIIGPTMQESEGLSLPLGQAIVVGGEELTDNHYPELEAAQFKPDPIEGYMLRSVPNRIWSRISKEAVGRGFCFEILGQSLMASFKRKFPIIQATEIIFVTSGREDIAQFDAIAEGMRKFSGELKKLVRQGDDTYKCTVYECSTCDNESVCNAIREWIVLRRKATSKEVEYVNKPHQPIGS